MIEDMNGRKMPEGLVHRMMESDEQFFERIDKCGGWPVGYKFVGFEHSDGRAAGFCNSPHGNGWWTVLNSADDYYMWKLSDEARERLIHGVLSSAFVGIRQTITVKNHRGYLTLFRGIKQ